MTSGTSDEEICKQLSLGMIFGFVGGIITGISFGMAFMWSALR